MPGVLAAWECVGRAAGAVSAAAIATNFDREPIDRWAHIYTLFDISRYDIDICHEVRTSTMIADKISRAGESIGSRDGIAAQTLHSTNRQHVDKLGLRGLRAPRALRSRPGPSPPARYLPAPAPSQWRVVCPGDTRLLRYISFAIDNYLHYSLLSIKLYSYLNETESIAACLHNMYKHKDWGAATTCHFSVVLNE